MLPEPSVRVSRDPAIADSGLQSVSAGLCSVSVVCDHSGMHNYNGLLSNNSLFDLSKLLFSLKFDSNPSHNIKSVKSDSQLTTLTIF